MLPPRTLSAWLQSLVALVVAVDAPGQAVSSDSVSTRRALLRLLEAWMVVFDGVSSLDAGSGSEQDNVDAFGFAKQLLDVIAARPSAPWLMKLWSLCGNWRESVLSRRTVSWLSRCAPWGETGVGSIIQSSYCTQGPVNTTD